MDKIFAENKNIMMFSPFKNVFSSFFYDVFNARCSINDDIYRSNEEEFIRGGSWFYNQSTLTTEKNKNR